MGDASAVSLASESIASSLIQYPEYFYGIRDHVRGLQRELELICGLLDLDANRHRAIHDNTLVVLTRRIREVAFRAEDAIDTYVVHAEAMIFRKNLFSKLASLISLCYPVHMLTKEIEAIQIELQEATSRLQILGIIPGLERQAPSRSKPIPEDYIHLRDDQGVVGLEEDIFRLVERLTDPEDDFRVVSIVGTGGAGKTTLATQLYRHPQVASRFLHKAFVSVSKEWSISELLHSIFIQLKGVSWNSSSETELVQELHYFLKDKQCLIVLDDIWHKEAWDAIYPILPRTRGSKFILTTRSKDVALYADIKCIIYETKPLIQDQMWTLFSKIAMEGRVHIENNGEFEKLGKQMLAKCGGLPLAVVAIAGILRTKQELYQWEEISREYGMNILKAKGAHNYGIVEDILELSYHDLPRYLQPCFLYLAIFPEDCDIPVQTLTRMWIAEGFIITEKMGHGTPEDVAMHFLQELAQRSIIQVTSRSVQGHIEQCRLHDLMRALCILKAKECHFSETVHSTDPIVREPSQHRRLSILSREYFLEDNKNLRTLVQFETSYGHGVLKPDGPIKNLESVEKRFKLLRVLNIWGFEHVALPKQVGKLIHLRYLGIKANRISKLPKSVRNLRNLLYIDFHSPGDLEAEHAIDLFSKMENLRGVVLPYLIRNSFKSLGLYRSKNLHSLISGAGKWMKEELPRLSPTLQNLAVYEIEEMEELEAIYRCPGITADYICTLKCDYKASGLEFDLGQLMHCRTLWSLELNGLLKNRYERAIRFPEKLVKLCLSCSRIEEWPDLMQVLGDLPCLKHLSLSYGAYLGMQLRCTDSAFPMLQELHLAKLYNLEEWEMGDGAMARLLKIDIENCQKLKKLPESIRSITTLKELQIASMPEEFCRRLGYGGKDSYIIQHIPSVKISIGQL